MDDDWIARPPVDSKQQVLIDTSRSDLGVAAVNALKEWAEQFKFELVWMADVQMDRLIAGSFVHIPLHWGERQPRKSPLEILEETLRDTHFGMVSMDVDDVKAYDIEVGLINTLRNYPESKLYGPGKSPRTASIPHMERGRRNQPFQGKRR